MLIFFFSALALRSTFGVTISDIVTRSSIALCNSVSADRIVMVTSRLLGAATACIILLFFVLEHHKSYWTGCIQAAIVIWQQIFVLSTIIIFLWTYFLKNTSKSFFSALVSRSGFEAAIAEPVARSSIVLCTSVSADLIVVAVSSIYGRAYKRWNNNSSMADGRRRFFLVVSFL